MLQLLAQYSATGSTSSGPSDGEAAVAIVAIIVMFLVFIVVSLAITAVVCYFIYKPYSKVPQQFQQMSPKMVWLLMIPFFNLVWVFFIAIQIPASFKAYFDSIGDTTVGDAGKAIGLAWAICMACSIIPYLGACIAIGALVCMIIFLVKINGMGGKIEGIPASAPPAAPPPAI